MFGDLVGLYHRAHKNYEYRHIEPDNHYASCEREATITRDPVFAINHFTSYLKCI